MTAVVVNTNVPIVANGKNTEASLECIKTCVQMLARLTSGQARRVVIDDAFRILKEYQRNLTPFTGQLPGDVFFTWLFNNQYDTAVCERVQITNASSDPNDFAEFPNVSELATFDRSDRKFVAVALTSQHQPEIVNAVDTDWWLFRVALEQHGIRIRFLCPVGFLCPDAMPK